MAKLISSRSRKNEEYHKSNRDTREMPYKEDIIHKAVKDGLPTAIQEEAKKKFGSDYRTIPPK